MTPFQIKICGVTRASDVRTLADAGADAIGLNFYAKSKRFLAPERVAEMSSVIPASLKRVGVFVNASIEEIASAVNAAQLDYVQLHGDESAADIAALIKALPALRSRIIKAFRVKNSVAEVVDPFVAECATREITLAAILIDAWSGEEYGGTGKMVESEDLREWIALQNVSVILAGGLTPKNIAQAIQTLCPHGVDTASGVESAPGEKDTRLVNDFVTGARNALNYPSA
jgi:phosphoribosylanthranilate isomerase